MLTFLLACLLICSLAYLLACLLDWLLARSFACLLDWLLAHLLAYREGRYARGSHGACPRGSSSGSSIAPVPRGFCCRCDQQRRARSSNPSIRGRGRGYHLDPAAGAKPRPLRGYHPCSPLPPPRMIRTRGSSDIHTPCASAPPHTLRLCTSTHPAPLHLLHTLRLCTSTHPAPLHLMHTLRLCNSTHPASLHLNTPCASATPHNLHLCTSCTPCTSAPPHTLHLCTSCTLCTFAPSAHPA